MKRLSLALMLACALAQPAFASSLVASALALGIHAHDHGHSVVLHADGDHIDMVLSHHDEPGDHDHPAAASEADHVVHLSNGEIANASARRAVVQSPHAFELPLALPAPVARAFPPIRSPALRARGVEQLRTVVLLI